MIPLMLLVLMFAIIVSVPELRDAEPVAGHRGEPAPDEEVSRHGPGQPRAAPRRRESLAREAGTVALDIRSRKP